MLAEEIFSTPFIMFQIDDPSLNSDLRDILLAEASSNSSNDISNIGGWHSEGLQNRQEECFKKLQKITISKLKELVDAKTGGKYKPLWNVTSWAVVNNKGHYNMPHSHPHSDWSSVYYVDGGDEVQGAHSGNMLISDPRGTVLEMSRCRVDVPEFYKAMFGDTNVRLKPYSGLLVFFPSWLTHSVLPYEGKRPRICIAANYHLHGFKENKGSSK